MTKTVTKKKSKSPDQESSPMFLPRVPRRERRTKVTKKKKKMGVIAIRLSSLWAICPLEPLKTHSPHISPSMVRSPMLKCPRDPMVNPRVLPLFNSLPIRRHRMLSLKRMVRNLMEET